MKFIAMVVFSIIVAELSSAARQIRGSRNLDEGSFSVENVAPTQLWATVSPTESPTIFNDGSCMSGSTVVTRFREEWEREEMTKIQDLEVGDKIKGLDSRKEEAVCTVVSIIQSGLGKFYGNYTADHYVYNAKTRSMITHDRKGEITFDQQYDVITDCPLGVDESGVGFAGISKKFCAGEFAELSWVDYLRLHESILRLMAMTGLYDYSAFESMDDTMRHLDGVCSAMIKCIRAGGTKNEAKGCDALERKSRVFYDKLLTQKARKNIDQRRKKHRTAAGASFPEIGGGAITNVVATSIFGSAR